MCVGEGEKGRRKSEPSRTSESCLDFISYLFPGMALGTPAQLWVQPANGVVSAPYCFRPAAPNCKYIPATMPEATGKER